VHVSVAQLIVLLDLLLPHASISCGFSKSQKTVPLVASSQIVVCDDLIHQQCLFDLQECIILLGHLVAGIFQFLCVFKALYKGDIP
jgi:hypothetical protein